MSIKYWLKLGIHAMGVRIQGVLSNSKQALATLHLTRLSVAIGAVADIWLVLILTRSDTDFVGTSVYSIPWWSALLATAIVAVCMCGFAASLNDTLDARHDVAFHPNRPIPRGLVSMSHATVVMVASLLMTLLAASFLGTWPVQIALLTAAAVLFYNTVGKFIPAVGLVTIGLLYATHMLIANIELTFTLPVWLVMTHAMVCAISVYVLEGKRPILSFRGWVGIVLGWIFWSAVILGGPYARTGSLLPDGMSVYSLIWIVTAIVGFVVTVRWKILHARSHRIAAEKIRRYGALWECLYAGAWLAALQLTWASVAMFGFALTAGVVVTLVKESTGGSGKPLAWRL
ncbi:UbiA family prenyltransferase [PVC group bacterium]|nr:UbiA family prenyltransferase [PVC group bacterium]